MLMAGSLDIEAIAAISLFTSPSIRLYVPGKLYPGINEFCWLMHIDSYADLCTGSPARAEAGTRYLPFSRRRRAREPPAHRTAAHGLVHGHFNIGYA